ncbi:MAG: hypothetical protein M0R76_10415, partial [Proteobacteria bacterium]|nr:hypothetical protein [Pseudomonadota bacterium]
MKRLAYALCLSLGLVALTAGCKEATLDATNDDDPVDTTPADKQPDGDTDKTPDGGDDTDTGKTPDGGDDTDTGKTPDDGDDTDTGKTPDGGDDTDTGKTPDDGDDTGTDTGDDTVTGAPVGEACTVDADCAGPGTPQCLLGGLYPLSSLSESPDETAQMLATLGVNLPGNYCSTAGSCTTDDDCGQGGSCFFPLRDADPDLFVVLVGALGLSETDSALVGGFLNFGQCLKACDTNDDCPREGYTCATPIGDFIGLVPNADLSTYCIGEAIDYCEDAPCQNGGACENLPTGFICDCADTGFEGETCEIEINECEPNPCQNGGTCTDGINEFTCE